MAAHFHHILMPHVQVRTSSLIEWAWAGARLGLVVLAGLGAFLFLRGTDAFGPVLGLLGGVLLYNAWAAALLHKGRLRAAFLAGFALDNVALLMGWWVVASALSQTTRQPSTDLYLVMFPLALIGVVRLGMVLGGIYVAIWGAWMGWADRHFYGPDSYEAEQFPIRLLALVITAGLAAWLVSQRDEARRMGRLISGQYEALFETMSDAVFIASADGKVLDVNDAALEMLGVVQTKDILGAPLENLVPRGDREGFREAFQRAITGEPVTQELTLQAAGARAVPVEVRASSADLQDMVVWLGIARDQSARREMEEQLLRGERLRVMGQIASGIAHDVNNALTPILGYSELLSKSNTHRSNEEYLVKTLGVIHTSAQDAAAVVARLREFYRARSEHEVVMPVDLNSVARQAVALAEIRRKEREFETGTLISIVSDLDPAGAVVLGREDELRQALLNLVFNSMDALTKGGVVTLSTRRTSDGTVTLTVADDGAGMTPDALARCLEPFFTTKGKQGTGLGLPMVQGCIRRHGGTMDISSEVGKGTTIEMRLPLHEEKAKIVSEEDVPAARERLLIVDDEPAVRDLLSEYALALGHDVETAPDGEEALEMALANDFSLVLTDMSMPGMSGMELGGAVKKAKPETPVVIITGFQDLIASAGEAIWESVDMVLNKPVTLDVLDEAIESMLRKGASA